MSTPKYRVEVIADNSGEWAGNGLKFDTATEAVEYARDLMSRWMLVREWRILANCRTPEAPDEWQVITLEGGAK